MQVGFNCLLSHKGNILLMLPLTYKGFNRLVLMYINTLWLDAAFECINILWLGDMLDITHVIF